MDKAVRLQAIVSVQGKILARGLSRVLDEPEAKMHELNGPDEPAALAQEAPPEPLLNPDSKEIC